MAEPEITMRERRRLLALQRTRTPDTYTLATPETELRVTMRELMELVVALRPEERSWHVPHRATTPEDSDWVVTLVAEVTPEEHLVKLIEAVGVLASAPGENGEPLSRSRYTQRQLMKRGIAVTTA